jgi:VWFA-related protein
MVTRRRSHAVSLVAVCLLAAMPMGAQVAEQITVDVVEVPVHVVRRGKAVEGLTRDVFELYVNGKRHPFDYFDVIDSRAALPTPVESLGAGAASVTAAPLDRRTLTVLLFDTVATSHRYLVQASEAAQKFIAEAPKGETFAVARLNPDGVQFLVPFTADRFAAARAARTLRPSAAGDDWLWRRSSPRESP